MTWLPLLLSNNSPVFRRLVLKHLMTKPNDDPELLELERLIPDDPILKELSLLQQKDGSWRRFAVPTHQEPIRLTAYAMMRLGFLGLDKTHPMIRKASEYLFSKQLTDGSWPIPHGVEDSEPKTGYSMIPMQTAVPLRGLAACGYANDKRSINAYQWLLDKRLPDGAWPTGIVSDDYGFVAGYRRISHSRWGCRSNTTASLLCLSLHPEFRRGEEARRALDLLLGRETREIHSMGQETARMAGLEIFRGFFTYFARFDPAMVLDLCRRIGGNLDDPRIKALVNFIKDQQGPYGLWEYQSNPSANHWITYDLLRSLSKIDQKTEWINTEPRTPFQPYPKRHHRY